ncbi:hypothetical protein EV426DRAFT_576676 [Tirmania nivea]|nr:hypothetical protein EV426DRAFT_576676 [Tirmania nivea]
MDADEAMLLPIERNNFWIERFKDWRESQEKLGPADILKISYQPSLWLRSACDMPDKREFRLIATDVWKEVDKERLRAAYEESVSVKCLPPRRPWDLDADPQHATLYRHNSSFHQFGTLIPQIMRHAKKTYPYETFKRILKEVADSKQEVQSIYSEWKNIKRYVFLGHAGCTFAVEPGKNIGQLLMFKKIVETMHQKQGRKGLCEMYASVELKHHSLLKPEKFANGRVDPRWSRKDFEKELTKKGKRRWETRLSEEKEFLKKEFDIYLLSRSDILGRTSLFTDAKDTLLFAPNSVLTSKDLTYISRQNFQILLCRNLIGRQEISKLARGKLRWPHKLYKIPSPPFVTPETQESKEFDLRIAYLKSHYQRDLPTSYALGRNLVDDVPYGDSLDYCIYWPSPDPTKPHKHFCWIWDLLEVNRPTYLEKREQESRRQSKSKHHHPSEDATNSDPKVRHLDSESCFKLAHMWTRKVRMMVDYYNVAKKPAYETLPKRGSEKARDLMRPF